MDRSIVVIDKSTVVVSRYGLTGNHAHWLAVDLQCEPYNWTTPKPTPQVVKLPRRLFRGRHGQRAYHNTWALTHGLRPSQIL